MNIIGFVKKYGDTSFVEKPFNNVDALILITLSYLNFEIFSSPDEEKSLLIKDIPDDSIIKLCAGEFTTKPNEKIIKIMKKAKRYQDIEVKYIHSVYDKLNTIQFFGMTLIIPDYHPLICFRGTDLTLVGWKEDLMLALHDVVPSQIEALNYVNYVSKKIEGPFSIGGHSKGGNLAMFASIFSQKEIQERFDKVYSLDGPGFRKKEVYNIDKFYRIKDKIIQIIPRDDVVGALFFTPKDKLVVDAKGIHFMQHNPYFWTVKDNGDFKYLKRERKNVRVRRRTMVLWASELNPEECEFLIDKVVESLGGIEANLSNRFHIAFSKFHSFIFRHLNFKKEDKRRLSKSRIRFIEIYRDSKKYYRHHKDED